MEAQQVHCAHCGCWLPLICCDHDNMSFKNKNASPLTIGLGQIQPFKVCKVSIIEGKKEKIMFEGNNYSYITSTVTTIRAVFAIVKLQKY